MGHYVYLLHCADGTLYTGYTTDVARRVAVHNAGKGAKYTRSRLPVEYLAHHAYPTKNLALAAEYRVRRLGPAQKRQLVEGASWPLA